MIFLVSCGGSDSGGNSTSAPEKTTITSVSPSIFDVRGGERAYLESGPFQQQANYSVLVNDVVATDVEIESEQKLSFVVPEGEKTGTANIVLMKDATVVARLNDKAEYSGVVPLTVYSITPSQVDLAVSDTVVVVGKGFNEQLTLYVADQPTPYHLVNSRRLEFSLPVHLEGDINIRLEQGEQSLSPTAPVNVTNNQVAISSLQPAEINTSGGTEVRILGGRFSPDTRVSVAGTPIELVTYISEQELLITTPFHSPGTVTVEVSQGADDNNLKRATAHLLYIDPFADVQPYLVSATALSNTQVRAQFSEPMSSSLLQASYSFVGEIGAAGLAVTDIKFADTAQTTVDIDVLPMSEMNYTLVVTGARDASGVAISLADRNQNNQAIFYGVGDSSQADSDNDGLSDSQEQRGFTVRYQTLDGEWISEDVSSDPLKADTDGDGLNDIDEYTERTHPRLADTDRDQLSDGDEADQFGSDPLKQDTDGDGLHDFEELNFGTSLVLADTDGDQFSDYAELFERNRNPRIADIPLPQVEVESLTAAIDVRYTSTEFNGESRTSEETFSTTRSRESGGSDTTTNTVSLGAGFGDGSAPEGGLSFVAGFLSRFWFSANYEDQQESSSYHANLNEFNNSSASSFASETTSEITREVIDGRITVAVNFSTLSDVAFTLRNIELSLIIRDNENPDAYKPIATLLPINTDLEVNIGPLASSRGPILFHADAPIPSEVEAIMKNPTPYAVEVANYNLVDENQRNFAYSSQEINERTATLAIVYNDGQTAKEQHRIATSGLFDLATGAQLGVSLDAALKGLQLYPVDDAGKTVAEIEISSQPSPAGDGALLPGEVYLNRSYSITNGQLTRVRSTQVQMESGQPKGYDSWVLLNNNGRAIPVANLETTYLKQGETYLLTYTRDVDGDGLTLAEEMLLGTKDTQCDTDGDTLSDYREVYGKPIPYFLAENQNAPRAQLKNLCEYGAQYPIYDATTPEFYTWRIGIFENSDVSIRSYRAYSNPLIADSDDDGLDDGTEFAMRTRSDELPPIWYSDPLLKDTDDDGLNDAKESELGSDLNIRDSDGDGLTDGLEVALKNDPLDGTDASRVNDQDNDGLIDRFEGSGAINACGDSYFYTGNFKPASTSDQDGDGLPDVWEYYLCTNPFSADTDGDKLSDFDEWNHSSTVDYENTDSNLTFNAQRFAQAKAACDYAKNCNLKSAINGKESLKLGTNPLVKDTDGDGLKDNDEVDGWQVWLEEYTSDGRVAPYNVTSNPLIADADGDGLNDGEEYKAKTDSNKKDTDGDGRDDAKDRGDGFNPLQVDFEVEFSIRNINVLENGEALTKGSPPNEVTNPQEFAAIYFYYIDLVSPLGDGESVQFLTKGGNRNSRTRRKTLGDQFESNTKCPSSSGLISVKDGDSAFYDGVNKLTKTVILNRYSKLYYSMKVGEMVDGGSPPTPQCTFSSGYAAPNIGLDLDWVMLSGGVGNSSYEISGADFIGNEFQVYEYAPTEVRKLREGKSFDNNRPDIRIGIVGRRVRNN
ncbi:IPT/TIG domain-containing protein [Bacterioplanoides sp. SCSIO 12839]|uniref:IPT/TIG domain-containing protein n=1 Tax=Bacterioplanoides sp. SCSIO 12839 TaxID=2829569 RepID=UPI002102D35A|nr:IPT/TIG domain-containing protein [Bacterioplanoides sp. SCSIO 12839]UTW48270.1 IPT/TIG domain-containing protein [Bacterioplanoides sp. SCSIO 12839]